MHIHSIMSVLLDSRIFTPSQSAPDSPSLHQGTMSRAALSGEQDIHRLVKPFRCGTPSSTATVGEENIVQRRKEYSSAIRQHMSRPRTADQAIGRSHQAIGRSTKTNPIKLKSIFPSLKSIFQAYS